MDGNADVILKETRQGKTVTSAVLDVCYPAAKGSDRKDRFVANLAVNGQTLTGTTQSLGDKLPVTVKLTRKPTGDTFEFKGQISVGQTVTEVTSADNSDLSEKEFLDNQTTDDGITPAPKDFTEVSPESIGVKVKLDAAPDFLKSLKGQDVEVSLSSLTVTCDALRAGEQTISISADPDRAAALIAKFKSLPGVVAAGWTSGIVEMERAIRFSAADWRDGDKLNRDKLAAAIAAVLTKTLAAKSSVAAWNANTGKLKLTFKRPSQLFPALDLTETVEVTALVAPDKPGGIRPADAVDRQSRRSRPPTNPPAPSSIWPTNPAATRKATRRTTTARSRRWPRNSRASAGTRTSRSGNSRDCDRCPRRPGLRAIAENLSWC